jgi:hypothetical protein
MTYALLKFVHVLGAILIGAVDSYAFTGTCL